VALLLSLALWCALSACWRSAYGDWPWALRPARRPWWDDDPDPLRRRLAEIRDAAGEGIYDREGLIDLPSLESQVEQALRSPPRPTQSRHGWQKPVAPPRAGARPAGLPPRPGCACAECERVRRDYLTRHAAPSLFPRPEMERRKLA
jgi:hypothetical protein